MVTKSVNFQDYDNRSALHIAVCDKKIRVIKILLRNNADPNLEDRWGKTAFDEADGNDELLKVLNLNKDVISSDDES